MFLLNILLLLVLLFGAGWAFGRSLAILPVLMSLAPFIWHITGQLYSFKASGDFEVPFDVYLALSVGLGAILLVIGIVWGYTYPLSVFLFPLLFFVVYLGPWQYLTGQSSQALGPSLNNLLFTSILASLATLSYLLPMILKLTPAPKLQPPTLDTKPLAKSSD
jgi:hypothetical protein